MSNTAVSAHKTDDKVIVLNADNAPAIFSDINANHCSQRYVHVPTHELVRVAGEAGWVPFNTNHSDLRSVGYGQRQRNKLSLAKDSNSAKTAAHFVALRPSDEYMQARNLAGRMEFSDQSYGISRDIPRILITNSHDTTVSTQIQMGIFTFICSNQAIMCSDDWGKWKFRHMNLSVEKLINFFRQIIDFSPYILDVRDEMMQLTVTHQQALEFADRVIDVRWDRKEENVNPADLLIARNGQQVRENAWHVFQRVQNVVTNGGFEAGIVNMEGRKQKKATRKQRAITDHAKHAKINAGLWKKAVEWIHDMGKQLPPPPQLNAYVK